MEHKFDFLVFIGRFQPFHNGHYEVIEQALKLSEKVIVLIGSADSPRTIKNPWTYEERRRMIASSTFESGTGRVILSPLRDVLYRDDEWVRNVDSIVGGLVSAHHQSPHKLPKIGLIGHVKDDSSYYLKLFPKWEFVEVENKELISATPIREMIFSRPDGHLQASPFLARNVEEKVTNLVLSNHYNGLVDEFKSIKGYKEAWKDAPYDPTFNTADSLVVCKDCVLLITRNNHPGKGLLAMPGGFVDTGETLFSASLRELLEETNIDVTQAELKLSLVNEQIFDHPDRSLRGRTITNVFHYDLGQEGDLPKIKASDDAAKAEWHPIRNLKPQVMFEDHYHIIRNMLNAVKLAS